jgi:hypothetical protein
MPPATAGPATGACDSPARASPAGIPKASIITRRVCTMVMPRTSAPLSAAMAMTCARAPGLAPSRADSGFQPCTRRR